ncbi:MAG: GDP-L-fucose synthase [Bacteroidota bacterium]|jgi:GDP-L-fucose synthase
MTNIFVAGHNGLVGSAIVRRLKHHYGNDVNIITRARSEVNLMDAAEVENFFVSNRINQVYLAAAHVGGIVGNNTYPADFIYANLMIQTNVIHAAYASGVRKMLFLGSTCVYPKLAEVPIKESALLTGPLESTNEPYAIAKIAGIKMCESYNRQYGTDYRSVLPCNLYGPGDSFNLETGHLVPSVLRKLHEAKKANATGVLLWGTGKPLREFLYVDDAADGCIKVMNEDRRVYEIITEPMQSHINLSSGWDIPIVQFARMAADTVGFTGEIRWDHTKPDGTFRKVTDNTKIKKMGWEPKNSLDEGLEKTYNWFLNNQGNIRT